MVALLLMISHLIGDFVLQSSKSAEEKQQSFSKLLKHCCLYALVIAAALLISTDSVSFIIPTVILVLSHFAIDFARIFFDKKASARLRLCSYFIDQLLHFAIIFIVTYAFNLEEHTGRLLQSAYNVFGVHSTSSFISYALIYLAMLQPTAVTVKKMLTYISSQGFPGKGTDTDADENTAANTDSDIPPPYNAGYLIGILERIIVATLVLQDQLSAIGFVLAAKSLARFNQLNDREFAEKYLVGSLTSIAIAIVVTLILK